MNKIAINTTDELIHYLIKSKKEMIKEIKSDFNKPEFQKALFELRALNNKKS